MPEFLLSIGITSEKLIGATWAFVVFIAGKLIKHWLANRKEHIKIYEDTLSLAAENRRIALEAVVEIELLISKFESLRFMIPALSEALENLKRAKTGIADPHYESANNFYLTLYEADSAHDFKEIKSYHKRAKHFVAQSSAANATAFKRYALLYDVLREEDAKHQPRP